MKIKFDSPEDYAQTSAVQFRQWLFDIVKFIKEGEYDTVNEVIEELDGFVDDIDEEIALLNTQIIIKTNGKQTK